MERSLSFDGALVPVLGVKLPESPGSSPSRNGTLMR